VARILLGDSTLPAPEMTIVLQVRLPRVLAALLIGAALATAGVALQGIFRNPLAAPGILGVSTGGSAGAVLAIVTGAALGGIWIIPVFSLVGSVLAALLVYVLALERGGRASVLMLVLAGTAVNAFLGAAISFALLSSQEIVRSQMILNWLVGGLAGRGWQHVTVSFAPILIGVALLYSFSRDLNLFLLGEETAQSLGTRVARTRFVLLGLAALLTGVSVSVAGPIGFIGLIVPHMLRLVIGPDHRVLLPASALGGAAFLVLADTVARLAISYQEVPVGVITGLVGGPFFLFLVWRYRKNTRFF
jgi:iron complex transport system permease protein